MRRALLLASAVVALLLLPTVARAQQPVPVRVAQPGYTPSAFTYGFQGLMLGAGAGLAAGYLFTRDGGFHENDVKTLIYGMGFGALVGGGLGVALGINDMAAGTPGGGYYVLRDAVYGLSFGTAAGAIAGALAALSTKRAEHILLGASIGALTGTVFGVALGIWEGERNRRVLTVGAAQAIDGRLVLMPSLLAAF
jgi:hypothetical protein